MARINKCRICELKLFQSKMTLERNAKKRMYWNRICGIKKEQIENMFLRKSRALSQFCCFEHYEEAELIQRDVDIQEGFRINEIKDSIERAFILEEEAEQALLFAITSNMENTKHPDVITAQKHLKHVRLKLRRRQRVLKEYYEKNERRSIEQLKRVNIAERDVKSQQQRIQAGIKRDCEVEENV
jgi:hypothetical protein